MSGAFEKIKKRNREAFRPLIPELRKQYEYLKKGAAPKPTLHGLVAKLVAEASPTFDEFLETLLDLGKFVKDANSEKKTPPKLSYVLAPAGTECTCGYRAVAIMTESENGTPYIHKHVCPAGVLITYAFQYSLRTIYLVSGRYKPKKGVAIELKNYTLTNEKAPNSIPILIVKGRTPPPEEVFL